MFALSIKVIFFLQFIVLLVYIVEVVYFQLLVHLFAVPLLYIVGVEKGEKAHVAAEMFDDRLPARLALLVEFPRKQKFPFGELVERRLVGREHAVGVNIFARPLEKPLFADGGEVEQEHARIAVAPVYEEFPQTVGNARKFVLRNVRVVKLGNIALAHGIYVEVQDFVGQALQFVHIQAEHCVGSIITLAVFPSRQRTAVGVAHIYEHGAAFGVFLAQNGVERLHLLFAERNIARVLFVQIHGKDVQPHGAGGMFDYRQSGEQHPGKYPSVAAVADVNGVVHGSLIVFCGTPAYGFAGAAFRFRYNIELIVSIVPYSAPQGKGKTETCRRNFAAATAKQARVIFVFRKNALAFAVWGAVGSIIFTARALSARMWYNKKKRRGGMEDCEECFMKNTGWKCGRY